MKNSQSFSILIWGIKAKKEGNGPLSLYARVTINGKRAEISLKKKVNPLKWDVHNGFMKGNTEETRMVNNHISEVKNELWRIYTEKQRLEIAFTAEDIKHAYTGQDAIHHSLLEVFDKHNKEMEALVGKDVVAATLTKYKTIRSKVAAFIEHHYGKPDLFLDNLEYEFITGFEQYLKTVSGIDHNTTMAYIKRVKRIVTISVDHKWIKQNPFSTFKCTTRKVTRQELSEDEIILLANKNFDVKRLEEVRDCFLFSCYTGYAFVDASKLTLGHIVAGKHGELWINTHRTKTAIAANVPLLPPALAIIEKYRDHEICRSTNKLLPIKSNQKMNAYLKEIANICGIAKNLTTHMARHTFATTVTLANDVPIESVSAMLGHTKITTTQIYARVKEKKVGRDMQALMGKLAS
ncbi:MAG: site-specific integrase [Mucilaginibacter sp.]|nr:site-specific integrase [Mucilaginibacter sp.]